MNPTEIQKRPEAKGTPARRMTLGSIKSGGASRPPRVLLYAYDKVGKAQPTDAQVLTPHGFVPMGELQVGSLVVGSDGRPTEVMGIFPQGSKQVFRVTMSDGAETECCDEHLWFTTTVADHAAGRAGSVKALHEIRDTIFDRPTGQRAFGDYPNHRVAVVAPVQFSPASACPLNPYVVGAFLGDGSLTRGSSISLHKPEADVLARVAALLPDDDEGRVYAEGASMRVCRKRRNNTPSETVLAFDALGLMGTESITKFIPSCYLMADVDARVELLRGLCDTDGHVISSGARVEFSTSSPRLRDDFMFLVRSLGGTVTLQSRIPHRMLIFFPDGLCPVSSEKHLARWKGPKPHHRSIASIESVGFKVCQCIRVAAPDGLYVTDDFVVTHNTTWSAGAPSPVFLGPEDGGAPEAKRFPLPTSWGEILEAVDELASAKHEYRTLVLDTADWIEPMVWDHVCHVNKVKQLEDVGGGYGKGFDQARDEWRLLLSRLETLRDRGMTIVILAHAEVKNFKNPIGPDFEKYQLKMNSKTAAILREWADAVLFARLETYEVTDKQKRTRGVSDGVRTVYTQPSAAYDAGNRLSLPPELPLDWSDFEAARTARQTATPDSLKAEIGELRAVAPAGSVDVAALDKVLAAAGSDAEKLARIRDRLRSKVGSKPTEVAK